MEKVHICYIFLGLLVVLNVIIIFIAVKCAHKVDDVSEFINEDGNHIYYDRKLIAHKKREEKQ